MFGMILVEGNHKAAPGLEFVFANRKACSDRGMLGVAAHTALASCMVSSWKSSYPLGVPSLDPSALGQSAA